MKAVQKDFWMEIRKSKARFFSIFFIVTLGVAFFSGIHASSPDMRLSGDAYFDSSELMDLKVISTLGLTEEDVEELGKIDGIEKAEGAFFTDVITTSNEEQMVIHVESINASMNCLTVNEGKMPQKSGELFLDHAYAENEGLQVGDTIKLEQEEDGLLKKTSYTITAIGSSPLYISFERGNTTLGSGEIAGFAYILPEDFDSEVYTQVCMMAHGADRLISYTDAYENLVEKVQERIEEISGERCEIRYASVMEEAEAELADARQELADGKREAEAELADARQKLEDGKKELADGEKELEDGRKELADGKKELEDGKKELADGKKELEDGKTQLADAKKELENGKIQLADGKRQLQAGWAEVSENQQVLTNARNELEAGKTQLANGKKELAAAKKLLRQKEQELEAGERQLEAGEEQLTASLAELSQGRQECEAGLEQLSAAETQLSQAQQLLDQEKEKLKPAQEQLSQLQGQKNDLEAQKSTLEGQKNQLAATEGQLIEEIASLEGQIAQLNSQNETEESQDGSQLQAQLEEKQAALAATRQEMQTIEESIVEVDTALSQLEPSLSQLEAQVSQALQELSSQQQTIEAGRGELEGQKAQLMAALTQIEQGEAEAAAARIELDKNRTQLNKGRRELNAAKKELKAQEQTLSENEALLAEKEQELLAGENQLNAGIAQLNASQALLTANEQKLTEGEAEIAANEQKLAEGEAEIAANEQKIADAEKEIEENEKKLTDAEKELADGRKELEDGEKEYEKGKKEAEEEIADAEKKLEEAEEEIGNIKKPEWIISDRNSLPEYSDYGGNADRIKNLGQVFPMIFFLVAALVSLTTMTRMVEERRTQIGTMKALGYSKLSIASKYMNYALLATLGGSVLGVLIGEKVIPYVIITAYGIMYHNMDASLTIPYELKYAIMASGASILCTLGATLFACFKALSETPASLMRPPAPKEGKRVLIERITPLWKRLNFTWKSTLRNIFRYKKRLFMTIFGIAGSMGLLLVGFGLRDSIAGIASCQYEELQHYDGMIIGDEDAKEAENQELQEFLMNHEKMERCSRVYLSTASTPKGKTDISVYLYVPEDLEAFREDITLRDRITKEVYELTDEGAVISEKTASFTDLKVGDSILLERDHKSYQVKVSAITENYMGHYVYMTPAVYEQTFGEKPDYTSSIFTMKEEYMEEMEDLGHEILKYPAALSISYTKSIAEQLERMLSTLVLVIFVLIISAGMLAFVVLYNLNNINITERQRELATLKVLGFYDGEVSGYVFRENIILTVLGVGMGIVLGFFLHQYVITTVEVDAVMFGRDIKIISYVISALITCCFSVIVNGFMHQKLKKIDMVESLKSVE